MQTLVFICVNFQATTDSMGMKWQKNVNWGFCTIGATSAIVRLAILGQVQSLFHKYTSHHAVLD